MQSNASPIPSLLIMEDFGIYDHIALHITTSRKKICKVKIAFFLEIQWKSIFKKLIFKKLIIQQKVVCIRPESQFIPAQKHSHTVPRLRGINQAESLKRGEIITKHGVPN